MDASKQSVFMCLVFERLSGYMRNDHLTGQRKVCWLSISERKHSAEGSGVTVVNSHRLSESDRVGPFSANPMSVKASKRRKIGGQNQRMGLEKECNNFDESGKTNKHQKQ